MILFAGLGNETGAPLYGDSASDRVVWRTQLPARIGGAIGVQHVDKSFLGMRGPWGVSVTSGSARFGSVERELAGEVLAFCDRHGILPEAQAAIELAKVCFAAAGVTAQVEHDPEGDAEWLVIGVATQGEVGEVLARHHRYTREWLRTAPPKAWGLIRLLYNIT